MRDLRAFASNIRAGASSTCEGIFTPGQESLEQKSGRRNARSGAIGRGGEPPS
jgi:hypothetical protein